MSNFPADILIIDDERQIRRLLNLTLTGAGYHVRECENGQLGLSETALKRPDAIILDLGLPDMDGMEILRRLRKWSGMPVVVISARSHEKDKVEALDERNIQVELRARSRMAISIPPVPSIQSIHISGREISVGSRTRRRATSFTTSVTW